MDSAERRKFSVSAGLAILTVVLMWVVYLLARFEFNDWFNYGIQPRQTDGLSGILFSPILHSPTDWSHILNNSVPMLFLSWALFYFFPRISWQVLSLIWVVGGLCVWLSAREGNHIGMSGVIYGLAAFHFTSGIISRNKNLMGLALLVVFLYGSMIWGIFPLQERVSWEGHLWGAINGVAYALVFRGNGPKRKKYQWEIDEEKEREALQKLQEQGDVQQEERTGPDGDVKVIYHFRPRIADESGEESSMEK